MLAHIVNLGNIIKLYESILVHVKLFVSFPYVTGSHIIKLASDSCQELIEINASTSILVKEFNQNSNLFRVKIYSEIS